MKLALFLISALCVLTLSAASLTESGLSTPSQADRMFAARLPGTWSMDEKLSFRLGGGDRSLFELKKLVITSDPSVLLNELKPLAARFAKDDILQAGYLWTNASGPFPYVFSSSGNDTHLTWFTVAGTDRTVEVGELRLGLSLDRDPADDLLFLGRDFRRQWGLGFRRM